MDASVVVCTYNRCQSLQRTLGAIAQQNVPTGVDWELLVVDNNSGDGTKQVVEAFCTQFPRARYCFERNQGLSHARNAGIRAARGNVILFTDDDVAPEAVRLRRINDGMAATHCDACGGYIAPVWETPPPRWLTSRFH